VRHLSGGPTIANRDELEADNAQGHEKQTNGERDNEKPPYDWHGFSSHPEEPSPHDFVALRKCSGLQLFVVQDKESTAQQIRTHCTPRQMRTP
jgi:hypothetical protein